ncbi:MAG: hypothetical protein AB7H97_18420, partial [Pseudobdellovibrionaceae bacterium]
DTPNRPDRPNRPDTPNRPDRPNRPDTPNRPDRPNRPDTPNRPDHPRPPDRPGRPDHRPPHRPNPPDCRGDSFRRGECLGHRPPPHRPPYRPPNRPPPYWPPDLPPYYPPSLPPNEPYLPPPSQEISLFCGFNGENYSVYNSIGNVMGTEYAGWRTAERCEESVYNSTENLTCAPTPDRERFVPVHVVTGLYIANPNTGFIEREACFRTIQNQVGYDVCVKEYDGAYSAYDLTTSERSHRNPRSYSTLANCIDNLQY